APGFVAALVISFIGATFLRWVIGVAGATSVRDGIEVALIIWFAFILLPSAPGLLFTKQSSTAFALTQVQHAIAMSAMGIVLTAVTMEVVFLTQAVQQVLRRAEVRRHFGFALWELHQELSEHLDSLERRIVLVRQGINSEPSAEALRTWASSVDAFPVDAWERFLAIGGLHRLLDSAPDQVASNLYRYYHGVASFNNEAALRERLLQKLFNVTGPATTGIFKN